MPVIGHDDEVRLRGEPERLEARAQLAEKAVHAAQREGDGDCALLQPQGEVRVLAADLRNNDRDDHRPGRGDPRQDTAGTGSVG
jgi:hypothetical protein